MSTAIVVPLTHKQKQALESLQHSLGPVWDFLNTPGVTEIMVNPDGRVWVEDNQRGMYLTKHSLSEVSRHNIVATVASLNDREVHEEDPSVGGILPGFGARFHGIVPPAVSGSSFAIRIPSEFVMSLEQYVQSGVMSKQQARLILGCIAKCKNIIVAGGTGSGKTTLSNAILKRLANSNHRIMTIEDTPELRCEAPNWLAVYINRQTKYTYQRALKDALRMRPDRIIVGEVRDGLAMETLLEAWNTGHPGGLATIHAKSSKGTMTNRDVARPSGRPQARNPDCRGC